MSTTNDTRPYISIYDGVMHVWPYGKSNHADARALTADRYFTVTFTRWRQISAAADAAMREAIIAQLQGGVTL